MNLNSRTDRQVLALVAQYLHDLSDKNQSAAGHAR
jgi:hypothetical protein